MNAPYEWPEMAIRSRSPTPRRTSSSTAAFAPATSCSTYESFGSRVPSPTIGIVGLSSTA